MGVSRAPAHVETHVARGTCAADVDWMERQRDVAGKGKARQDPDVSRTGAIIRMWPIARVRRVSVVPLARRPGGRPQYVKLYQ